MWARSVLLVGVCLLAPFTEGEARAQHFGRNKVEYIDFEFKVLDTRHFAIHYYADEEESARIVARLAERWYSRLSRVLEHELDSRQPLILYASQPEFAQTNVVSSFLGEGIGGVTEAARRRIVMPFAPTLAETDRILGHEITHAFQFDMARHYRGGTSWPLWAVEGLAQYLAFGGSDAETAMWLRDAVQSDLLPERQRDAASKFSPYRYGHALWAYLAGRFGDGVIPRILKARDAGSLQRRIKTVTGVELDRLYADWKSAAVEQYGTGGTLPSGSNDERREEKRAGRFYLGPSLSPDGTRAVFFSEQDRVSLDLFLADTETGKVLRKLATTAAAVRFESLQAIRSAGSWSPDGKQFAFAAVDRGQPVLVLLDVDSRRTQREIRLPQFGQILFPAWSPDGRAIAFSGLHGGVTDLYVYDLAEGSLRQITNDSYADVQPAWSADGKTIAFVTDRFSTDLAALRFGRCELALLTIESGDVSALPVFEGANHFNPQWSPDGSTLYFVADPAGVRNVYGLAIGSRELRQITDLSTGVSGLTPTSPAIAVARKAPVLAFTSYRSGKYAIDIRFGASVLAGAPVKTEHAAVPPALSPASRANGVVDEVLSDSETGLPSAGDIQTRSYDPDFFLEAMGPPYISSGGGPFGTFVRGGGSLLFSDLLGERKLALFAQAGNRLRDFAFRLQFLNRERRWNWGAVAEVQPTLRRLPHIWSTTSSDAPELTRETHYFERTNVRAAGLVAYPFDQARRLEFEAGARYTAYRRTVSTIVRSLSDGRLLSRDMTENDGEESSTGGEVTAAYVRDTAVFGPTSPILGARARFEVTRVFGDLSATRVVVDYRRYMMPKKPYTVAIRGVHLGQYGRDGGDPRVLPTFLGSRQFLRGYGWGTIRCELNADGACGGFDELLGRRLLVANLEVRAPLFGIGSGDLRYGPVPAEGFLFADSGLVWARTAEFSAAGQRRLVRSFGAGVRVNAFGLPLELAVVRAVDPPAPGWTFDVAFRSGF